MHEEGWTVVRACMRRRVVRKGDSLLMDIPIALELSMVQRLKQFEDLG